MKRSLLTRLRSNGVSYLLGALLILLALPFYQDIVMAPRGYGAVVEGLAGGHMAAYLHWIGTYPFQFVVYRFLFIVAFALLLSFPFSLSRIVVAQELMAQMEREEEQRAVQRARKEENGEDSADEQATDSGDSGDSGDALPPHPWRGKGFAITAAWAGLIGLILYIAGALLSTIYFFIVGHGFTLHAPLPPAVGVISNIFSVMTNTVGIGLLALALLFFGASIVRGGRNLWPVGWVLFGYAALVVAALFGGNALSVASTPAADQSAFTTPAILLFGLWMLWFGIMLVSLKPETS